MKSLVIFPAEEKFSLIILVFPSREGVFPTESEEQISGHSFSKVVIIFPQQEILFAFCM